MSWYRAGTVALTNGSTTVTGSGTAFIANAQIGEAFRGPDGREYEIADIPSNTQLTLAEPYLGSTASGQGYAILPLRGRIADLLAEAQSLIGSFVTVRDGIGAGLFPDGTVSLPAGRFASDQDTGWYRSGVNGLGIATGGVNRLNVDASGNVAIGMAHSGNRLDVGGTVNATAAGYGAYIMTSDSVTGQFAANGGGGWVEVRAVTNHPVVILTNNTERLRIGTSGHLTPGADNTQNIGSGSQRFATIFAGTGTINTSDAREKHWRGGPDEGALRAANRIIGELGFFQWEDSVAEKGEDRARIHFGVRAQQVMQIMAEEGLEDEQVLALDADTFILAADRPSFRHAFLCFDTWDDEFQPEMADVEVPIEEPTALIGEDGNPIMRVRMRKEPRPTGRMIQTRHAGNRFGLRVDQLTMFLLAALASRVAALESKKR